MNENVRIGRIPVMVKSRFCHLSGLSDENLRSKEDCAFDTGGYFIIKGSEKVMITQLRTSSILGGILVFLCLNFCRFQSENAYRPKAIRIKCRC